MKQKRNKKQREKGQRKQESWRKRDYHEDQLTSMEWLAGSSHRKRACGKEEHCLCGDSLRYFSGASTLGASLVDTPSGAITSHTGNQSRYFIITPPTDPKWYYLAC